MATLVRGRRSVGLAIFGIFGWMLMLLSQNGAAMIFKKKLYFGGIIPFKIPLRGQIFEAVSRDSRGDVGSVVVGGAFAAVDRHLHSN